MIRVLGDRVLVALPPKEHAQESTTGYTYQAGDTTASGLILAKPADVYNAELATRGIVMALGEKIGQVDLDDVLDLLERANGLITLSAPDWSMQKLATWIRGLAPPPFDVQVGDCVIFSASAGEEIFDDGVAYVIVHEAEIIGVVDPRRDLTAESVTDAMIGLLETGHLLR